MVNVNTNKSNFFFGARLEIKPRDDAAVNNFIEKNGQQEGVHDAEKELERIHNRDIVTLSYKGPSDKSKHD